MDRPSHPRLDSMLDAEPSAIESLTPAQMDQLTELLDRYLLSLEQGTPLSPQTLTEAHPDLAEPLNTYLKCLAGLHDVAAGFAPPTPVTDSPDNIEGETGERRLGDFVLLHEIGHGGMGVVYEAEQVSLGRRVALKVLPFASVLDSRQIARFKNEAQAAAQLSHPNIVPVYAVGSERGVHYYAMQLIDGQPLDCVIDTMKADATKCVGSAPPTSTANSTLVSQRSSRQRYYAAVARLGIQAAEALAAAHGFGVVHRDIKPSNLLIDADGKLWVTDFGLARCQSDRALTRTGDVVGTRRYMSPEQALGQAALVDQRTDVYSLGVTLYELLSLHSPFPEEPASLRRDDSNSEEVIRLRRWEPQISRDLETVIHKAMAWSREDRYLSAQELADDLKRVLDGSPIVAQRPGIGDRVGKWARRHRRIAAASAIFSLLALVALSIGNVLISQEKAQSEKNLARAERHFREAQSVVDRFGSQLAERLKDVPGADEVRRDLLAETQSYYENFVAEASADPTLRTELAQTQSKIGGLAAQIGTLDDAMAAQSKALALFEQLLAEQPESNHLRRQVGICRNNLAMALQRAGRTDEAKPQFLKAIEHQQSLAQHSTSDPQFAQDLGLSYNNLGSLLSETGKLPDAEQAFRDAIAIQQEMAQSSPGNADLLRALAASLNNLAAIQKERDEDEALRLYEQASQNLENALLARPGEAQLKCELALTLNNLAAVQSRVDNFRAATESFTRAIKTQKELVHAAPLQQAFRRDLAISFNNLGLMQSKLKERNEAEQSFKAALELQEALVKRNPGEIDLASSLGGIYNNLGIVLEEQDRTKEAAQCYLKAIEYQQTAFSRAGGVDRYRNYLSKHYYNYGRTLRQLGRGDDAARIALARKDLWPSDPQRLFSIAEELALASEILKAKPGSERNARKYAYAAAHLLRQSKALGMEFPTDFAKNKSFAPLMKDPEFQSLVNN